jgi:hypothetical protein
VRARKGGRPNGRGKGHAARGRTRPTARKEEEEEKEKEKEKERKRDFPEINQIPNLLLIGLKLFLGL